MSELLPGYDQWKMQSSDEPYRPAGSDDEPAYLPGDDPELDPLHFARWYDVRDNVTAQGQRLIDAHGYNSQELQQFYERPWRWGDEWNESQKTKHDNGG